MNLEANVLLGLDLEAVGHVKVEQVDACAIKVGNVVKYGSQQLDME